MRRIIAFVTFITLALLVGCGSGGSSSSDNTNATADQKSFSATSAPITINDIVNGTAAAITVDEKSTSASAPFYFGRFLYTDGNQLYTGAIKFKIVKNDDATAYFTDFTLENYSVVTDYDAHSNIVSSSTDLLVGNAYNAATNHAEIADATQRFVGFDLDFGNNTYFGDVTHAGVLFSSDFSTMAGGDNRNFFFIAQKIDSQPEVTASSITGAWNIVTFSVSSTTGLISLHGTASVDIGGNGGNGFTGFTGTNSDGQNFDGELSLTDPISGSFIFGYGSGDGSKTAQDVSGAFLISADQSLALGIDISTFRYFAAER